MRLAELQGLLCGYTRKQIHQAGDEPGPACLMTCAQPGAVVAVEVFVEQNVVAPVGIVLELPGAAIHRAVSIFLQKDSLQSLGNLSGNFEEAHLVAGASGTLNLEIVTIELVEV